MVLAATALEIGLAEATGKSVMTIRYSAARLLLELQLGRGLTPREAYRLTGKMSDSYPRIRGQGCVYIGETPEPDHLGALEVLKIIQRTGILETNEAEVPRP
ncbi:MAG: hypothetical protein ABIJ47_03925 [Candidatus Bathyarchaeota archaeon]